MGIARVSSSLILFTQTGCSGGGMVDALVSGASGESRAGSSPVLSTADSWAQHFPQAATIAPNL